MQGLLANRVVTLGVSGSIAIYKALELIRLLVKNGARVRVVMSQEAQKFITPLTFEALSGNKVLTDTNEDWSSDVNHIGFAKSDLFILAPASANSINKLANGIADTILLQVALAFQGKKLIAPSANTHMIKNPLTEASLKMLKVNGFGVIEPQSKKLVCKEEGVGALANVEDIYFKVAQTLLQEEYWVDRRVVVSAGGTVEKIDDVRFISNFSSGKMGHALALALYLKGADVCLISTKEKRDLPDEMCYIDVQSAEEMFGFLSDSVRIAKKGILKKPTLTNDLTSAQLVQKTPYLFMVAAVSDYTPAFAQQRKLKKANIGQKWDLELKENLNILDSLNKEGIKTVAFKAEMDEENALDEAKKLLNRGIDAVCLNVLKNSKSFGSDTNAITLLRGEETLDLGSDDKFALALKLLDEVHDGK